MCPQERCFKLVSPSFECITHFRVDTFATRLCNIDIFVDDLVDAEVGIAPASDQVTRRLNLVEIALVQGELDAERADGVVELDAPPVDRERQIVVAEFRAPDETCRIGIGGLRYEESIAALF